MLLFAIVLLTLMVLGNVLLSFSIIGGLGTSQTALFSEVQSQARITRRALVQLLDPPEQTDEQKTLAAVIASPEFSACVIEDARKKCEAQGIDWFGDNNGETRTC